MLFRSCVKTPAGGSAGAPTDVTSITLANGDSAVCSITNNDNPPSLTLNKIVVNDNGGTRTESEWTLTANGGTAGTLSGAGASGSADVVSGSGFKAGTYALSESGTYAGYTNGTTFSCVKTPAGGSAGAPTDVTSITLANGDSAVCSITNNDDAPRLKVVKACVPATDTGKFNQIGRAHV